MELRRTVVAAGVVLGAVAVLGTAVAAAGTAPGAREDQAGAAPAFNVVATTKVGPKPGRLTYGFGATWTLNSDGSVSRVDATTHAVKTVKLGPNPRDIRAGYNKIWVLTSTKTQAKIFPLTPDGFPVGSPIIFDLGSTVDQGSSAGVNGANTLGIGSGDVWAAGVKTWQKLARIDPDSGKVVIKTWPIPAAFVAAQSALWMVTPNQASIQKRDPSSLAIESTLKVSGFTGGTAQSLWLTYGLDFLWLSTATPNDDGAIAKVSPTSGLVPGAVSQGLNIGLSCTAAGASAVWATQRADALSSAPATLFKLDQSNLKTLASGTLPIGANPGAVQCVAVGGGLVYVTDGVGSLTTIQP
jgi:hypothetical protein